jgi:hypothetical protein
VNELLISIEKYFNSERAESMVFMLMAVIATAFAAWFWFYKPQPFLKGMACPLAVVALIHFAVGVSVYRRSPEDSRRVTAFVQNEPHKIESEEIPRMRQVMRQFAVLRWSEIGLFLAGLGLFFFFRSGNAFWAGIGMGLAVQAGLSLFLDFLAELRGHAYLEVLLNFIKK